MLPHSLYQYRYFNPTYALFITLIFILNIWIANALLKGLASARDPAHRVTLMGPRYFFDEVFRRRLRRQLPFWFLFPVLLFAFISLFDPQYQYFSGPQLLYYRLGLPVELVWSALLSVTCFFLIGPRFRSVMALVVVSFLLSLGAELIVLEIYQFALPNEWRYFTSWEAFRTEFWEGLARRVQGTAPSMPGYAKLLQSYDLLEYYFLFPAIAGWLLAWRWARHKGNAWFRLEEDA